jgi:uncharacterized membrane protein
MHWGFTDIVELAGKVIDGFGVAIIVLGAMYATEEYLRRQLKRPRDPAVDNYKMYRQTFGRSILMGLEFLVAGDIIRTVAVKPTFTSVGVLAILILIRSFLSFSMELEIEGHLPWKKKEKKLEA